MRGPASREGKLRIVNSVVNVVRILNMWMKTFMLFVQYLPLAHNKVVLWNQVYMGLSLIRKSTHTPIRKMRSQPSAHLVEEQKTYSSIAS